MLRFLYERKQIRLHLRRVSVFLLYNCASYPITGQGAFVFGRGVKLYDKSSI
ncbi:hypothetical protein SAMN04487895_105235 [Paenibacillus sophorae]|uniref:Uncharacterized protein n=1 Tax=Paenibacillus sophorae TaxID=1333845 RepID=A0A1H8MHC9_9BACL|nr:hypothetical protein SAMN04487895_105235 [Paenibacillus sophorae]